jgi:hypothetical protein
VRAAQPNHPLGEAQEGVSRHAGGQLPRTGDGAAVHPAGGVDRHAPAAEVLQVHLLHGRLEEGQQPVDAHSSTRCWQSAPTQRGAGKIRCRPRRRSSAGASLQHENPRRPCNTRRERTRHAPRIGLESRSLLAWMLPTGRPTQPGRRWQEHSCRQSRQIARAQRFSNDL